MDLNAIKGLVSGEVVSSENTISYTALKTTEGNITFTPMGDNRLNTVFSEWVVLKDINSAEHQNILNMMNSCEWDKKVDFVNGEFVKVERYTLEEKEVIIAQRTANEKKSFFNSEKRIALEIEEDFRLDLGVTEVEMEEVKMYIKSIKPSEAVVLKRSIAPQVQRPEVMFRYDNKEV
ncbi:MAG: hypothetical protein ACRDDY_03835 [Clostridium sp.]|uniref:hypothetical protein n=1 Tax=Clostridium sp. TaxID=1506 RepID=UPI003EE64411